MVSRALALRLALGAAALVEPLAAQLSDVIVYTHSSSSGSPELANSAVEVAR
jgi:hypothetical protein